ncbi:MAG: DUF2079 domain-containing protein [Eubacteriales bacterium]|nr:DUF2079 domain-containing protein [Eubacteriales bacterium]
MGTVKLTIKNNPAVILTSAISAWCITGLLTIFINRDSSFNKLEFIRMQNPLLFAASLVVFFSVFLFLGRIAKDYDKLILFFSTFSYAFSTIFISQDFNFYIGMMLVMTAVVFYVSESIQGMQFKITDKRLSICLGIMAAFFILFVGGLTSLRYLSFSSPGFDFGIFAQMFENMKETGLPYTTCERNILLSHFEVHISPIYYLMLPFYMIFPSPVTLQVLQAVIVASGIIPLYLLLKHYKFSNKSIIAVALIYTFYPALSGACFYDMHENAFLAPMILWLFYFLERDRTWLIVLAAILIFFVKEDAPVHVAFIGLYFMASKRNIRKGAVLFVLSIVYFGIAMFLLSSYGQGVMTFRYDNYMYEDGGLFTIIKAVLLNPAYSIYESTKPEKIVFMLQMLLPLGFVPLISKKYSQLLLLVPFILLHLMTCYVYQYEIGYQYTFATGVVLLYLFIINLSKINQKMRRTILIFCMTASVLMFSSLVLRETYQITYYVDYREQCDTIEECLNEIPEEDSVSASSFFVAHLYRHDELYHFPYEKDTDYIVLDLRFGKDEEAFYSYMANENYEMMLNKKNMIAVFKNSAYNFQ